MWKNDTSRVLFTYITRYEPRRIVRAFKRAADLGQIKLMSNIHGNDRLVKNTYMVTVAILQTKITENGLSAYVTEAVGYSFCSCKDNFSKKVGRIQATCRAMESSGINWDGSFGCLLQEVCERV